MTTLLDILTNAETAAPLFTLVAGWFGLDNWRKKRVATAAEVDRWASTAAGVVLLAVRAGAFGPNDEGVVTAILAKFKTFAKVAGVEVSPKHEVRALLLAQEAVAAYGKAAMGVELANLKRAADAMIVDIERREKLL